MVVNCYYPKVISLFLKYFLSDKNDGCLNQLDSNSTRTLLQTEELTTEPQLFLNRKENNIKLLKQIKIETTILLKLS